MGWYVTQAIRLRRDDWPHAKQLAEELFAMLTGDAPTASNSQAQINAPAGTPPLQLGNLSLGDSLVSLRGRDGNVIGDLVLEGDGLNFVGPGATPAAQPARPASTGGGGIPAQIVSGTGDTYTATVYPKGLSGPTDNVTVKQLSIDPSDTIPAGTWTLVALQADGQYVMQLPVWF
jgi:hypothetical protein